MRDETTGTARPARPSPASTPPLVPTGNSIEEPDPRHHGQRMHDAVEDVCDRLLRSENPVQEAGGTPATVIITIDIDDLLNKTGYAVASDGTLIPTEPSPSSRSRPRYTPHSSPARPSAARPDPADRHLRPNRRPNRPRPRLLLPRLRHRPRMDRTTPCLALDRRRQHRPDNLTLLLPLPPPQLRQQRLALPDQPRRTTRMDTTLVDRPATSTPMINTRIRSTLAAKAHRRQ